MAGAGSPNLTSPVNVVIMNASTGAILTNSTGTTQLAIANVTSPITVQFQ